MPLKNPEASRLTGNVNFVFVETLVDAYALQLSDTRFVDGKGRYRREKAGTYSFAIKYSTSDVGKPSRAKNCRRHCAANSCLFPRLRRTRLSTLARTNDHGRMMNRE
jgi:hypothetical protein